MRRPRPPLLNEGELLGHPAANARRGRLPGANTRGVASFDIAAVGPDVHGGIHEVPQSGPARSDAFDDHQNRSMGDSYRAHTAVHVPSRRPVGNWLALVQRLQDAADQEIGPAEAGMGPRDVIGVDHANCRGLLG